MTRGFTLPELTLVLFISTLILSVSVPGVQRLYQNYLMKSLAVELRSLFAQARVEALYGREDIWIHYQGAGEKSGTGWQLLLSREDVITRITRSNISLTSSWQSVKFDWRTGRVAESGNLEFFMPGNRSNSLKLIAHFMTGRVRFCATGTETFGYPGC